MGSANEIEAKSLDPFIHTRSLSLSLSPLFHLSPLPLLLFPFVSLREHIQSYRSEIIFEMSPCVKYCVCVCVCIAGALEYDVVVVVVVQTGA